MAWHSRFLTDIFSLHNHNKPIWKQHFTIQKCIFYRKISILSTRKVFIIIPGRFWRRFQSSRLWKIISKFPKFFVMCQPSFEATCFETAVNTETIILGHWLVIIDTSAFLFFGCWNRLKKRVGFELQSLVDHLRAVRVCQLRKLRRRIYSSLRQTYATSLKSGFAKKTLPLYDRVFVF